MLSIFLRSFHYCFNSGDYTIMRFTLFIDNLSNAKNFKIKDFCMEMKGKNTISTIPIMGVLAILFSPVLSN